MEVAHIMARKKSLVPADFADDDFCRVLVTVEKKPEVEFVIDEETGDVKPRIKQRKNPALVTIPILIDPNGLNVVPANLFIRFKANNTDDLQTLDSKMRALKSFYRFLWRERLTIYDVTDDPENGVVYLYRDHLLKNIKKEERDENDNVIIVGTYSPSTAMGYVNTIVRYFEFLHVERIVRFTKDYCPFEYTTKPVSKRKRSLDHDMLGHIKKGDEMIYVETTGLTKPFGSVQPLETAHKLSPMLEDEKQVFYDNLDYEDTNFQRHSEIKDLMLYTATETGLRVEELVTFPETVVRAPRPHEEYVSATISELRNGCMTKFNKERTIKIPRKLMIILNQYRTSKAREAHIQKGLLKHNALFVNPSNGLIFDTNTIQKHLGSIRRIIIDNLEKQDSDDRWYFTMHDLRATFATHWLYEQHKKTGTIFDVLLDDLKTIMGHKDSATTQKYIKYMKTEEYWLMFAQQKNHYLTQITGNLTAVKGS